MFVGVGNYLWISLGLMVGFFLIVVAVGAVFGFFLGRSIGWGALAERFPQTTPPDFTVWVAGATLGGVSFQGTLFLGRSSTALHLAAAPPFSISMKKLAIPLSEVQFLGFGQGLLGPYAEVQLANTMSMYIPARMWKRVAPDFATWQQAQDAARVTALRDWQQGQPPPPPVDAVRFPPPPKR